jgi:hypothetical protein
MNSSLKEKQDVVLSPYSLARWSDSFLNQFFENILWRGHIVLFLEYSIHSIQSLCDYSMHNIVSIKLT